MKKLRLAGFGLLAPLALAGLTSAQFGGGGGGFGRGGFGGGGRQRYGLQEYTYGNEPITPLPDDRDNVPTWEVDPHFKSDVFTFVRIRFTTDRGGEFGGGFRGRFGGGGGTANGYSWKNDWPDADLNLSYRLQQLTSMKVDPNPLELEITDPRLFDYPLIYTQQVGRLVFTDEELPVLRRYLLNGGFLMVGDFWGPDAAEHWHQQLKRLFPDREQQDLPLSHPIFHCVFDLKALPQVPTLQVWERDREMGHPEISSRAPADDPGPHYRAVLDDKGRIMILSCMNIDTGDAYQRERDDEDFFHRFSEAQGYPLGINVLFYVMTH